VANFLGVVSVFGSLIFVGMDLHQSQQIALGGQQQARTAHIAELWLAGLEGESGTLSVMQSEWETLTPHQKSVKEQMQAFFDYVRRQFSSVRTWFSRRSYVESDVAANFNKVE
tara:strand:+ start:374 stop:712 length:339 start_codon:yes stop_codon:yes gene_type:complete